jgi:hypothetical protein
MSNDSSTKLSELIEREREIIKKMNIALRANANPQILSHFDFLLTEVRFQQQEIRAKQRLDNKDSDFDNFLSIG